MPQKKVSEYITEYVSCQKKRSTNPPLSDVELRVQALFMLADAFTDEITTLVGKGLTIQGHRRIREVLGLDDVEPS